MVGDPALVEDIASHLSRRLLKIFETEIPTIKDWSTREKRLKWVLRNQVELLGRISVARELVDVLVASEVSQTTKPMENLIHEYNFLLQDLLLLVNDVEYPTWNLLNFADPDYWFALSAIPAAIIDKFDNPLRITSATAPPALVDEFHERLIGCGVDRATIDSAVAALADWLQKVQKFEELMNSLYEAEDPVESLYAFHYCFSAVVEILSCTLIIQLVLKPLRNQVRQLFC